ncbi:hypothetical protein MKEN_00542800 [Mycena kentingensis (nom. inval.)]|nr:hypothetical protein MKEN_00542800 [Mycena kentingensis (nom. inval.)]
MSTNLDIVSHLSEARIILRSGVLHPPTTLARVGEESLVQAQEEVDKLEAQLEATRERRDLLIDYIAAFNGVSAPIRRIPREILGLIFQDVVEMARSEELGELHTPAKELASLQQVPLFRLSQVCFVWKQVVDGTPALWTLQGVDATVWSDIPVPPAFLLRLFSRNLRRSRDLPLDLFLKTGPNTFTAAGILNACFKEAHRLRNMYIYVPFPPYGCLAVPHSFSQLEMVMMVYANDDDWLLPIQHAPRLRVFELRDSEGDWEGLAPERRGYLTTIPKFPWSETPYFDSTAFIAGGPLFSEIIAKLPARATARVHAGFSTFERISPPICSGLQSLRIESHIDDLPENPAALGDVLASLTLPNLTDLGICGPVATDSAVVHWSPAEYADLAKRSEFAHHLTALELCVVITPSELIAVLAALPLLERLDVQEIAPSVLINDVLLHALADIEVLQLPALEAVALKHASLYFSDEALFALAQSRSDQLTMPSWGTQRQRVWWYILMMTVAIDSNKGIVTQPTLFCTPTIPRRPLTPTIPLTALFDPDSSSTPTPTPGTQSAADACPTATSQHPDHSDAPGLFGVVSESPWCQLEALAKLEQRRKPSRCFSFGSRSKSNHPHATPIALPACLLMSRGSDNPGPSPPALGGICFVSVHHLCESRRRPFVSLDSAAKSPPRNCSLDLGVAVAGFYDEILFFCETMLFGGTHRCCKLFLLLRLRVACNCPDSMVLVASQRERGGGALYLWLESFQSRNGRHDGKEVPISQIASPVLVSFTSTYAYLDIGAVVRHASSAADGF